MAQRPIPQSLHDDIRKLIDALAKDNIRVDRAILFGSHAKGNASEFSDIDLALVSPDFCGIRFLDNQRLGKAVIRVNDLFDTHPFTREDFADSPFVRDEILKYGIEVC